MYLPYFGQDLESKKKVDGILAHVCMQAFPFSSQKPKLTHEEWEPNIGVLCNAAKLLGLIISAQNGKNAKKMFEVCLISYPEYKFVKSDKIHTEKIKGKKTETMFLTSCNEP